MKDQKKFKERISLLRKFLQKKKVFPSYSQMCDLFGVKSKNTIHFFVQKLINKGFVKKDSSGKIIPLNLANSLRLLGEVQAGFPTDAEEHLWDNISLDEFLIRKPEATFLLEVKGDSMIEEGIKQGDLVLVEKGARVRNGDVVIACVDGEWTLKFFFKEKDKVKLIPANKKYSAIYPEQSLELGGKVIGVIRKYS